MNSSLSLKSPRVLLSLILLLAAALRLYHLGFESYWVDEIYAFRVTDGSLWKTITFQDVHPPLYYTLIHYWIHAFGRGEAALRFFSVIFGFLSVWFIYRLGKTLFGVTAGLMAAYLLAFSKFHINYSQEARSYALFVFVSIASFYFLVRLFQKGERKYFIRYFAATLLMLYTHNFAMWAVAFQNLFVFMTFLVRPKDQKFSLFEWLAWQAAAFLVYLPWFLTCLMHAGDIKESYWIGKPSFAVLRDTFFEYAGGGKLFVLFVFSGLALLPSLIKVRRQEVWTILGCAGWLLVTLALPYAVSLLWTPIYYIRYTIASSIPYYLMAGYIWTHVRPTLLQRVLWGAVSVLLLLSIAQYHTEVRKEEWRNAAAYMDSLSRPGDFAVFSRAGVQTYQFYTKKNDCEASAFPQTPDEGVVQEEFKRVTVDNIALLDGMIAARNRVWLVVSHSRDKDELIPTRLKYLGYREIESRYFGPDAMDHSKYVDSRQIFVKLFEK